MVHMLAQIFEAKVDHFLTQDFVSTMFLAPFFGQKNLLPVFVFLSFCCFFGGGKCGPLIDPIEGKMGTTY